MKNPKSFYDWLAALKDYFAWYKIEDPQHVPFVKRKMRGSARLWWQSIDNNNIGFDRPAITTWIVTHQKLESKYLHSDYISTMQIELLASKQDFLTVDIYTDKFQELNICAKVNEDDLI